MTPDDLKALTHGALYRAAAAAGFRFVLVPAPDGDEGVAVRSPAAADPYPPDLDALETELAARFGRGFREFALLALLAAGPVPTAGYDGRLLWSDGLPPRPTEPAALAVAVPPPPPPPPEFAFAGFAVVRTAGDPIPALTLAAAVRAWVEVGTAVGTIMAFVRHPSGIELWSMFSPERGWDEKYAFA